MKFASILFMLIVLAFSIVKGQDPTFSQIDNMTPYYHCSFLNINSGVEVRLAHRNQWNQVDNGFSTYYVSTSYKPEKLRTSFGVNVMQDSEGAGYLTTQKFDLVFRQQLPFNHKKFKSVTLGGYVGVAKKDVDFSKLVFSDQIDPVFGIYQNSSQVAPDHEATVFIDCGISITSNINLDIFEYRIPTNISVSLNHFLSKRDESLQEINTTLPALFTITVSGTMQKSNLYNVPLLKPSLQYERQTNIHRMKIGSLIGVIGDVNNNAFYAGVYYSMFVHPELKQNASAIIPLVGYEKTFNDLLLSIGYSYDVLLNGIGLTETGGTHEITLTMSFNTGPKKFKQSSNIFNRCPD